MAFFLGIRKELDQLEHARVLFTQTLGKVDG
jgi:hypothetical protein